MIIGDKDIWQFGDEYIDSNTGESATAEEIVIFKKWADEQKIRGEENKKIRLQEEKDWHLKYDPLIRKFFEYDEYEEDDIQEDLSHMDDNYLAYQLATCMFDRTSGFNYFREQHPDDWESLLNKMCLDIKEIFPDHWEQALDNFKNRHHDT